MTVHPRRSPEALLQWRHVSDYSFDTFTMITALKCIPHSWIQYNKSGYKTYHTCTAEPNRQRPHKGTHKLQTVSHKRPSSTLREEENLVPSCSSSYLRALDRHDEPARRCLVNIPLHLQKKKKKKIWPTTKPRCDGLPWNLRKLQPIIRPRHKHPWPSVIWCWYLMPWPCLSPTCSSWAGPQQAWPLPPPSSER